MECTFYSVFFAKCDVSIKEDWTNLWAEAEKSLKGPIDILINNAGLMPYVIF
jgi:NAD(P)-dependent dehydrogenase (short-subunit alcohol dehydrogenase family)